MPVAAQWIAEVLPATHFMRMIRGIVLRGADLFDLWRDTIWMIGFTLFGLILASFRFKNPSTEPIQPRFGAGFYYTK